jgi:hypothetical protein
MYRKIPVLFAVLFLTALAKDPVIIVAIQNKDTNELIQLVGKPGVIDEPDSYGITGLMYAASSGSEVFVDALLKSGKSLLNAQDKDGRTALIHAVVAGQMAIVKRLLDEGADKRIRTKEKKTAIDYARADVAMLLNPPVVPNRSSIPGEAASIDNSPVASTAAELHREQMNRNSQVTMEYLMATDKKITGVTLNLLLPSLGSFIIGDFVGGSITLVMVAGTVVSYVLGAPIVVSILATVVTEIVNLACPLVYGTSLQNIAWGVALARF